MILTIKRYLSAYYAYLHKERRRISGIFPKERMGIIRYLSTVSDRFMKVTFSN